MATHADPIVIEVEHFMPAHNVFHEQAVAAFMEAHPDIVIKSRDAPPSYDGQCQALRRQAITNNLPEVYHSGDHLLPDVVHQLQKRGQVITLDGYIAKEGEGWVNKAALAPEYLCTFYDANPNWYTSVRRISHAAPWGGYPGTNGVKIWRTRRDIIGQVIRGISLRKTVSPS